MAVYSHGSAKALLTECAVYLRLESCGDFSLTYLSINFQGNFSQYTHSTLEAIWSEDFNSMNIVGRGYSNCKTEKDSSKLHGTFCFEVQDLNDTDDCTTDDNLNF